MRVAEVQSLLKEDTLGLIDSADTSELLISAILNLHHEGLLFDSRARWVKKHRNFAALTGRDHIHKCLWHVDLANILPGEASWSISLVSDFKRLLHGHLSVIAIIAEGEAENFAGELKTHGVCLRLHKESEGPIVDVVCDGDVEGLDLLRAEHNVEASLLSGWDHLTQRGTVAQLWVLVDHESDVDALAKIVRDVKRLGRLTLDEDVFEVDLLGSSDDLLQLLSCQFDLAVTELVLRRWLRLKLLLHDTVVRLLLASPHTIEVRSSGFVLSNRFLHVERVNLLDEFKLWLGRSHIHSEVKVVFDLLEGHRWRLLSLFNLHSDSHVFFAIHTLVLHQVVEPCLVGLDSQILFDIVLFLFQLVLVETVEDLVRVLLSLLGQSVDLSCSRLVVINVVTLRVEVLAFGGGTSQHFALRAKFVRGTGELDRGLVGALQDLETHLSVEISKILGLKRDVDGMLSVGQKLTTGGCCPELGHL